MSNVPLQADSDRGPQQHQNQFPHEVTGARPGRSEFGRVFRYTAIAVALVAAVAVGYCTPLIRAPITDSPFSSDGWLRGDVQTRGRMARNLVSSQQLMRKPRVEVLAVLGTPDVERFAGQTIRYRVDIGYRWVFQSHLYDLVVRFGKGNEVFEVAIEPCEEP